MLLEALAHRDAVAHDLLRQLRLGDRQPVLHLDRREVLIGADLERHGDDTGRCCRWSSGSRSGPWPAELLLDRSRHRLGGGLGVGARVDRGDLDRRRHDRGNCAIGSTKIETAPTMRSAARARSQDRAVDEELGEHRGPAVDGSVGASVAGAAGRRVIRWSTITRSPADSPFSTIQPPVQSPARRPRLRLPSAPTTNTVAPPGVCRTRRFGTTIASSRRRR